MTGKILKGIGGFYYIAAADGRTYEARGRGLLRLKNIHPVAGDTAEFDIIDGTDCKAVLTDIQQRKNSLLRPPVANVDQVLAVFAAADPKPSLNLIDRYLIRLDSEGIDVVLYFSKTDLVSGEEARELADIYTKAGYGVITGSNQDKETTDRLSRLLKGKTTVLAGPSGAGKSTLTNVLTGRKVMETGELSEKIKRGKQTTRHSELICIEPGTYLADTPGFTSILSPQVDSRELKYCYREFAPFEAGCRYAGCQHVNEGEAVCAVRRAVKNGDINQQRYENYRLIHADIKDREGRF